MTSVISLVPTPNQAPQSFFGVARTSFIAPAGVTAYAAFDAISDASGGAIVLTGAGVSGKIVGATLAMSNVPSAGTGNIDLLLFEAEPPNVADNAPAGGISLASQLGLYVGTVSFNSANQVLDVSSFVTWPGTINGGQLCYMAPTVGVLWGLLICRATFTFPANTVFSIGLSLERS